MADWAQSTNELTNNFNGALKLARETERSFEARAHGDRFLTGQKQNNV